MVVIRLARSGAKKRPFYHIVVADKRSPRDGKYIARLGYFNPIASGKDLKLSINKDLLQEWIKKGAKMSERVKSLVSKDEKEADKSE